MHQKIKPAKYFFILGSNPALSLAEIFGLFNNLNGKDNYAKIITFCKDFLIVETDIKIDSNKLMSALGGTIKIGIVLESQNFNIVACNLIEKINIDKNKKFYLGFSAYGKINVNFQQLAMSVKKELKQKNMSSRWVVSGEKQLSSVVVKKNKLIGENGAEWCVMENQNKIFWGKTLAVQEFEDYSKRDFDRPKRDSRSGMIPPKLAKIMINLARAELGGNTKDDITLLDPFCGSGTILQEAAILGMDKLIGSDLSEKAIWDSRQNLKWLEERLNISPRSSDGRLQRGQLCLGDISILHCDVRKLSELISENSVDLIVAEPYLGPPLNGRENENKINQIVQELSALYLSAFEEFKKVLKEGGCVCMVWPVFIIYEKNNKFKKNIFLPILNEVIKMGFRHVGFEESNYANLIFNNEGEFKNFTPTPQYSEEKLRRSNSGDKLKNFKKNFANNFSENGNIIYGRDGQMVKREIMIFQNTA